MISVTVRKSGSGWVVRFRVYLMRRGSELGLAPLPPNIPCPKSFEEGLMSYLIWSVEHAAWWAPAGLGYTTATHRAGLYELEEATGIVTEANRGPHLSEIMVPAPQPSQIDHDLTCDLSWPEAQRAGRVDAALAKQLSRSIANNCELQSRRSRGQRRQAPGRSCRGTERSARQDRAMGQGLSAGCVPGAGSRQGARLAGGRRHHAGQHQHALHAPRY